MSFFDHDPELQRIGAQIEAQARQTFGERGVPPDQFAYVLTRPGRDGARPGGAALHANWQCYPCSLVKVFFLVAAQAALDRGEISAHAELDRAMEDMIRWSSNTATNYVIDLLTGTTGDTLLTEAELPDWLERRQAVNGHFASLGWPELRGINLDQKLMDDLRYGRERIALEHSPVGHNVLTPIAMARLMHEIFHGQLVPEPSAERLRDILARDPDSLVRARGAYQVAGYLAAGMPPGSRIWSKAGRTRWLRDERADFRRHDTLRTLLPGGQDFTLTVFTQSEAIAEDDTFLPRIGELAAREIGVSLASS